MTNKTAYSILIAAGGTGGHVFPAIAIADALRELRPDNQIAFVGTKKKLEWHAVPKAGYPIHPVWISGFHRQWNPENFLFPFKLITSLWQSYAIVKHLKPDVFISCGGYVAGPTGWIAAKQGVPIFIQEQNSYPGVTNRVLAKHAEVIYTAFDQADSWFPKGKTRLLGNPTRKQLTVMDRSLALEHFNLNPSRKTILILGGSGGSKTINEAITRHLDELHHQQGLQILWQCGVKYEDKIRQEVDLKAYPHLRLMAFIDRMEAAYAAADLVISRSGAGSCAELMLTGKPSILVPSPYVAGNHQYKNAMAMANFGAAIVINDEEITQNLSDRIKAVLQDEERCRVMSEAMHRLATPEAAMNIANDILDRMDQRSHR
jgi:UDP-N-acetylglucosamine--N-acetylmuramyl-(pentapeptide) pyrophosphoryl-undecaprenol N-acetylglucosamine transferase